MSAARVDLAPVLGPRRPTIIVAVRIGHAAAQRTMHESVSTGAGYSQNAKAVFARFRAQLATVWE